MQGRLAICLQSSGREAFSSQLFEHQMLPVCTLLICGPGLMAEMPPRSPSLFSFPFLCREPCLPPHPWRVLHKDGALLGSQEEMPPECKQELGEGKGEKLNLRRGRPGRDPEAVGGLRPGTPREPPPPRVWHRQPSKGRPVTHPAFCAREPQRRGKNTSSVLTEETNRSRTQGPARKPRSQVARASELSIPGEMAWAQLSALLGTAAAGTSTGGVLRALGSVPGQVPRRMQDARGQALAAPL